MKSTYVWIRSLSGLGEVLAKVTYRGVRPYYRLARTGIVPTGKVGATRIATSKEVEKYLGAKNG